MGANIAGIYGAQIFREDDKPRYRRAFAVACAVLAFGLVLAIVRYIDNKIREKRKKRQIDDTSSEEGEGRGVGGGIGKVVPPAEDIPAPIVDGRRPSI